MEAKEFTIEFQQSQIPTEKENGHNFRRTQDLAWSLETQKFDKERCGRVRHIREIFDDPNTDYLTKRKIQKIYWPEYSSSKTKEWALRVAWDTLEIIPETKKIIENKKPTDLQEGEILKLFSLLRSDAPEVFDWFESIQYDDLFSYLDEPDLHRRYEVTPNEHRPKNLYSKKGFAYSKISPSFACIYDQNEDIDTFFTLSGLESDGKIVPEKLELEDILKREGIELENFGESRFRSLLEKYRFLISPSFRYIVQETFGIELKNFSVRTQVQFLNFLVGKTDNDVEKVKNFLRKGNSEDRLKAFLSLEQGGAEMGERILTIGEKLPKEVADVVFAKYAEMADRAGEARRNSEKDLNARESKLFKEEHSLPALVVKYSEKENNAIETKLLEKGRSLLSWIAKHAEDFAHDEKLLSALYNRLETLNTEIILEVSALREAKENENSEKAEKHYDRSFFALDGNISEEKKGESKVIREFLESSFHILKGEELSEKMITEMENLYRMSYPSNHEEKFREKLVKDLHEKKISDPSARFYAFFTAEGGQESLRAFCSFQDKEDESGSPFVYFGAFNVDEFLSGEKMGCLMMDESLEREAKGRMVRADCISEKLISEHYIEKRGFVGSDFSNLEGIDLLAIERDDKNFGRYETKSMTQEEIIQKAEAGFKDTSRIFLSVSEQIFSRESIEANLKNEFVLTRMFRRGEGEATKVYLAFEK